MNKLYTYSDKFIYRLPRYKFCDLYRGLNDAQFLSNKLKSNIFGESIINVSKELYIEYKKYLNGQLNAADTKRMNTTLLKYYIRMCTRSTPFGAFAACGVGHISNTTNFSKYNKFKYCYSYDLSFLYPIATQALTNGLCIRHLSLSKNPSIYKVDNRLRYYYVDYSNNCVTIKDVILTELLQFILKWTNTNATYKSLSSKLKLNFDISNQQICQYIEALINAQILITELTPTINRTEYFERLQSIIEKGGTNDLKYYTNLISANLKALKNKSTQIRLNTLEDILINNRQNTYSSIFHLDTFIEGKKCTINNSIIPQLQELFVLLCNSIDGHLNPISSFVSNYIKRYDHEEKPLLELLDPDIGIGYNKHQLVQSKFKEFYINSQERATNTNINIRISTIEKIILDCINNIGHFDKHEIILTQHDFKNQNKINCDQFPPTLACMFDFIINEESTYINNVRFLGVSAANLLSRFAYGDKRIKSITSQIAAFENKFYQSQKVCEIVHIPQLHTSNVLNRDFNHKCLIDYLTYTSPNSHEHINLNDIYIRIKNNMVQLFLKSTNEIILPRLTSAHNYHYRTNDVYQFLCDLQNQDLIPGISFNITNLLKIFNHLPRISYKSVILSLETWVIDSSLITPSILESLQEFKLYLSSRGIPKFITYSIGDNVLVLSIDNIGCLEILIREIKKHNKIQLKEYLYTAPKQTSKYEIIIPMYKNYDTKKILSRR
jgi:hypothetical protein